MTAVLDRVRRGFYMDSAALMRLSQRIAALPDVEQAALMIGSESNKRLLAEAGLLAASGRAAAANDLVIAVRAASREAAAAALAEAEAQLDRPELRRGPGGEYRPRGLAAALEILPGANLALVSVPGEFAAAAAQGALRRGLHVMIFSDNVPLAEERALKEEARERGLLVMGPDCGTAIIAGAPLGFANAVPRGAIGIVSASGTGAQEVACLLAASGGGISHAIGVGGRDLDAAIGGITTLMAIDALEDDPRTQHIILVSKPPSPAVARIILDRVARLAKPVTACFLGLDGMSLPGNARFAATLREAAALALGRPLAATVPSGAAIAQAAARLAPGRRWIRGLYSGGTLCAEAQVVLTRAGEPCHSNVPIPGVARLATAAPPAAGHRLVDLGADQFTIGRPHAMIDPTMRVPHLAHALAEPDVAVVLLDIVLGYGAHDDPARAVADAVAAAPAERPVVIASLCGTDGDKQGYERQRETLHRAGILIARANADAAAAALAILRR